MENTNAAPSVSRSSEALPHFWPLLCLFAFLSWLISGYSVYSSNQALQFPIVHLAGDSSLYPGDPFVETLFLYATYFWPLVARLSRVVPFEFLLILLFAAERLLFVYAAAVLGRSFYPTSREAPLAAMALAAVCPNPLIGDGTLTIPYLEQTAFAVPFLLLALASFYRRRIIACALFAAAGFNLNAMYGTYLATYLLIGFLMAGDCRREWLKWIGGGMLCLLLSAPSLFFILSSLGRPSPDGALWMEAARFRFPHHLFPGAWTWKAYLAFAVLFSASLAVIRLRRKEDPHFSRSLSAWTITALLWLGFAYLAAYAFELPALLVTHPARGTDLWHASAAVAVFCAIAVRYRAEHSPAVRYLLLGALLLNLLFWVGRFRTEATLLIIFVFIPILATVLLLSRRQGGDHRSPSGANPARPLAPLLIAAVSVLALLQVADRAGEEGGLRRALVLTPPPHQVELADWAAKHTRKSDTFLISPEWKIFRVLSRRPVFVTIKDGSAILWDRSYAGVWLERLHALGVTTSPAADDWWHFDSKAFYSRLRDEDVLELAGKYHVTHWIVPAGGDTSFPVEYRSGGYVVLRIPPPGETGGGE